MEVPNEDAIRTSGHGQVPCVPEMDALDYCQVRQWSVCLSSTLVLLTNELSFCYPSFYWTIYWVIFSNCLLNYSKSCQIENSARRDRENDAISNLLTRACQILCKVTLCQSATGCTCNHLHLQPPATTYVTYIYGITYVTMVTYITYVTYTTYTTKKHR